MKSNKNPGKGTNKRPSDKPIRAGAKKALKAMGDREDKDKPHGKRKVPKVSAPKGGFKSPPSSHSKKK